MGNNSDTGDGDGDRRTDAGPTGARPAATPGSSASVAALTSLWNDHDPQFDVELNNLAAAASRGDNVALNRLLTTIHVLTLARPAIVKVLVQPDAADEAMQRTLISVEKGIGSFNGDSKFRTWLHTVARNEALMVARTANREQSRTADAGPADQFDNSPDPGAGTRMSSVIATRETVRNAIDALEEPYRSTMQLRVNDQLEYAEIAERLEVPVGTIRSRLSKAQDLLKKRMFSSGQDQV